MACPHPGVRCWLLVGGVRSLGFKPKGCSFHPSGHRREEDRAGEQCEPSFASLSSILAGGMGGGGKGLAVVKRQAPDR
jgi:hypothetical protein